MALHKVAVAAKDGVGTAIPGGIQQHDTSGTGAGPNQPLIVLVDSTGAEVLAATSTNQASQLTQETAINTVLGTTAGAAVVTDVAGTVQQYLRGLVKLIAAGINVVITNANGNGSALSLNSAPVVIASDQLPVSTQLAPSASLVSGAITTAMTGTTSTSLVAAPGASLRNYITTIVVSNSHATVGTDVVIQDGSGGATLMTIPAAALYGGGVISLPAPLRQPTANTALFCANVTTGSSTKVSAVGFKAA